MSTFDKKALLAALKPKTQTISIEGFGDLSIMQLTNRQVETLRADLKKTDAIDEFGLRLVQLSVIDDAGERVFTDADIAELQASSNAAIDLLVTSALQLNGFTKAEAAKN